MTDEKVLGLGALQEALDNIRKSVENAPISIQSTSWHTILTERYKIVSEVLASLLRQAFSAEDIAFDYREYGLWSDSKLTKNAQKLKRWILKERFVPVGVAVGKERKNP